MHIVMQCDLCSLLDWFLEPRGKEDPEVSAIIWVLPTSMIAQPSKSVPRLLSMIYRGVFRCLVCI